MKPASISQDGMQLAIEESGIGIRYHLLKRAGIVPAPNSRFAK